MPIIASFISGSPHFPNSFNPSSPPNHIPFCVIYLLLPSPFPMSISQRPTLAHLRRRDLELDDAASTISSQSTSSSSSVPQPVTYPLRSTSTAVAKPNARLNSVVATAGSVALEVAKHWGPRLYKQLLYPHDPQAYFQHLLEVASNYEQWAEAANILDKLQGKDKWKDDPRSSDYDYELIATRLTQLRRAGAEGDLSNIIFLLRTSLSRNLGDMGKPKLYAYTHIGTKTLIEDYIGEVVRQLNVICDTESDDFDLKQQYEFFLNVRQSFGRTALLLSGGATLGLNHIGVIKCLHENRLLPRIISGASSGSIMAALMCTRTDEEIPQMFDPASVNLDFFEKANKPDSIANKLDRFVKSGFLYDVDVLTEAMKLNIGDMTFQEAYNRTRRILNITVSSGTQYEMPRLLNYLTAPNVLVWSAVAASCAVPGIFPSSPLFAKDKNGKVVTWNSSGHRWIDGSVENDLPMNKLSELFNVNHFIVCQVNPHVIPFLQKSLTPSRLTEFGGLALFLARSEIQHRCNQVSELGIFPSFFYRVQSIMSQRYYGDITIVPDIGYADFLKILSNPTSKMVIEATIRGEQATWPKVSIIKNHLQIELTIDEILYRLRLRRLTENLQQVEQNKQSVSPQQVNGDLLVGGNGTLKHRRQRSVGIAVGTIVSPLDITTPVPPGFPMRGSRSTPNVLSVEEKAPPTKRTERKKEGRREKERPKKKERKKESERVSLKRGLLMTRMESSETETKEDEWDEVVFGMGEGSGKSEEELTVESGSDGSGNGSESEGEESRSEGSEIESDYDDVEGDDVEGDDVEGDGGGETEDGNFTIESIDIDVMEN